MENFALLLEQANSGDAISQYKVGRAYESGDGVEKDINTAIMWYQKAAEGGYINATDCADYLAKRGIPFRDAYKVTGGLVAYCIENGKTLNSLTLEEYKMFSPVFENDVYHALDLATCVEDRKSAGGPAPVRVREQIESLRKFNQK